MTYGTEPIGIAFNNDELLYKGLTKREHFAALAMQGILASWDRLSMPSEQSVNAISERSIMCAEALINALNKEK